MNNRKSEILQKIKEKVKSIDQEAQIVLFGSQARNEETADSDWDILILLPYVVDRVFERSFRHALIEIELEYGIAISTFVYSEKTWHTRHQVTPFYKSVEQEGILL